MRRLIAGVLVALISNGCGGLGTPGFSVTVVNATGGTVTYFARGVGENANSAVSRGITLAPDQSDADHWLTPNSASGRQRARVWANDNSGRLVYCRDFTWDELKSAAFRVTLERADLRCTP